MSMQFGARTQAVIVLALVAALGAAVGILGDRLIAQRAAAEQPDRMPGMMGGPMRGDPPPARGVPGGSQVRYAEWLANVLELSPAQRTAIDSIVDASAVRVREVRQEMEPRLRQITRETRIGIDQVLTAEQRQQLRTLRQDRLRAQRPNPPRRGG